MKSPCCDNPADVIDSRECGGMRYRRQRCRNCQKTFTTYELTADQLAGIRDGGTQKITDTINGCIAALQKAIPPNEPASAFRRNRRT